MLITHIHLDLTLVVLGIALAKVVTPIIEAALAPDDHAPMTSDEALLKRIQDLEDKLARHERNAVKLRNAATMAARRSVVAAQEWAAVAAQLDGTGLKLE